MSISDVFFHQGHADQSLTVNRDFCDNIHLLDIAMQDLRAMRVFQCLGQTHHEADCVTLRHRAPL